MKKIIIAAALALAALPAAFAQNAAQGDSWTEAEVRRIDAANKKITLKHGEIKSMDMPPMTMAFGTAALPAEQLAGLKVGDKLRFQAAMVDGQARLTAVQR